MIVDEVQTKILPLNEGIFIMMKQYIICDIVPISLTSYKLM